MSKHFSDDERATTSSSISPDSWGMKSEQEMLEEISGGSLDEFGLSSSFLRHPKSESYDLGEGSKYRLKEINSNLLVEVEKIPSSHEMIEKWWEDIYKSSGGNEVLKKALFDLQGRLQTVEFDLQEKITRLEKRLKTAEELLKNGKPSNMSDEFTDEDGEFNNNGYSNGTG